MPQVVDAATVYTQRILTRAAGGNANLDAQQVGGLMKSDAWNRIQNNTYLQQHLELDTAMWYGALMSPGGAGVYDILQRSFQTLYYGGMIVKTTTGAWQAWTATGWPTAVAFSHGGRVLVQLPRQGDMPNGQADYFWDWLWGNMAKKPRAAATHGIDRGTDPDEALIYGRRLHMKEVGGKLAALKTSSGGSHWGVEIALGGAGNMNPYSGRASAPNGSSGHFYLYYLPPSATKYGGILIGCEGSSPADRKGAKTDDQYGGGHSIFGGSNTFSGTGGLKFGGAKLKNPGTGKKEKVGWQNVISGSKGNIIIDLTANGVNEVITKPPFQPQWVGSTGNPPVPPKPRRV